MENIIQIRLEEILNLLPFPNRDILLCGGAVKYICGFKDYYNDIDVIVKNDFVPKGEYETNIYGGFKVRNIDIWQLKNHIIPCKTFEEIQETWLLSCQAIYYDVEKNKLYDKYYNENLQINFNRDILPIEKKYINLKLREWNVKI